jgi:hypothetical protein
VFTYNPRLKPGVIQVVNIKGFSPIVLRICQIICIII